MDRKHLRSAQLVLRARAGYNGTIDGKAGPQSLAAAIRVGHQARLDWPPARRIVAAAQASLRQAGFAPGPTDGFWGVATDGAFLEWRAQGLGVPFLDRDGENFGRQADVVQRFGKPGAPACTAGRIISPWRMVLAWDTSTEISHIRCHADVAAAGQRAIDNVAASHSAVQLRELGLHLFGGCYNYRKKRGGSTMSMHAFGLAWDFDPARNRLTWGADRARLALPDAVGFWQSWEAEGFTSLGRARNYDWMHVQAGGF